jgi:RNA polymerase sigma factor (sigma-70 family)
METPSQQTSRSLLLRLRNPRDQDAWSTFLAVYGPLVYGHARRRGLGHEDAQDVTQKVFARVNAAIGNFEYQAEKGRFRNWLGSIVRHEVIRHWKKEEHQVRAQGGDSQTVEQVPGDSVDPEWSAEYHTHLLNTALARCQPHFEPATWRAFEQVWIDKRPAPEVAQEIGQPIDWVYVAKSRVLKRLWKEVQELGDDPPLL